MKKVMTLWNLGGNLGGGEAEAIPLPMILIVSAVI